MAVDFVGMKIEIPNEPLAIGVAVAALVLFLLVMIVVGGGRNKRGF